MKQFTLHLASFLLILLAFCGCSERQQERRQEFQRWREDNGHLKVLNTTAMITDLVKQIGGEHVDTLTLIQGDLDPHSYQLVKGDDEKLASAQIIFYNGLGLEHGPSLAQYLYGNPKAIALGDKLQQQDSQAVILVNGQQDPHIWTDISLWARVVPFIVDTLSRTDPAHRQEYQANGEKLLSEMQAAHHKTKSIMHEVPQERRYLVTSHDAFNYFTRAYLSEPSELQDGSWSKRFAAPEGLAPESQLSATDIQYIIDHMKKYNIEVLFSESNVSRDSINKIVQAGKEKGLNLRIACCPLYADAMGEPGSEGDSYLKMIVYNANMIASYMK